MPDKRRVEFDRQVGLRNHRVDRENVCTSPCACRLALGGRAIDRQIEIKSWSSAHPLHRTASARRTVNEPARAAQRDAPIRPAPPRSCCRGKGCGPAAGERRMLLGDRTRGARRLSWEPAAQPDGVEVGRSIVKAVDADAWRGALLAECGAHADACGFEELHRQSRCGRPSVAAELTAPESDPSDRNVAARESSARRSN